MNLFSTEQVSKYHSDKYADQISDALLTEYLRQDKNAHCGIETMVKDTVVVLAGEINSTADVDHEAVVRRVAKKLNYQVDYVDDLLGIQSPEINNAVQQSAQIGAGDQGMMYGFACSDSDSMLPYGFDMANKIIACLEKRAGIVLKGDAKTQVTVDRSIKGPDSLRTILISACHQEGLSLKAVQDYVKDTIKELEIPKHVQLIINPAGTWTIGGPTADAGLTGRKIVCDQYGGYCPVGGGAFSGKDPTKVDRSAAYMAREIACDLVTQEGLEWCEIQLAYAIGIPEPVSISVKNDRGYDLSKYVWGKYDLTPKGIIDYLKLYKKDYEHIAEGCHYRTRI